jgi:hypothetical protein
MGTWLSSIARNQNETRGALAGSGAAPFFVRAVDPNQDGWSVALHPVDCGGRITVAVHFTGRAAPTLQTWNKPTLPPPLITSLALISNICYGLEHGPGRAHQHLRSPGASDRNRYWRQPSRRGRARDASRRLDRGPDPHLHRDAWDRRLRHPRLARRRRQRAQCVQSAAARAWLRRGLGHGPPGRPPDRGAAIAGVPWLGRTHPPQRRYLGRAPLFRQWPGARRLAPARQACGGHGAGSPRGMRFRQAGRPRLRRGRFVARHCGESSFRHRQDDSGAGRRPATFTVAPAGRFLRGRGAAGESALSP